VVGCLVDDLGRMAYSGKINITLLLFYFIVFH